VAALKPVRAELVRRPEPVWGSVSGASNGDRPGVEPLDVGVKGRSYLKLKLAFAPSKDRQICPLLLIFGKGKIDRQPQHTGPGYTGEG